MVRSLRLPFDSRDFENPGTENPQVDIATTYALNPVLQKHYAALHALALEKNNVDDVPDMILPDMEGFGKVRC